MHAENTARRRATARAIGIIEKEYQLWMPLVLAIKLLAKRFMNISSQRAAQGHAHNKVVKTKNSDLSLKEIIDTLSANHPMLKMKKLTWETMACESSNNDA